MANITVGITTLLHGIEVAGIAAFAASGLIEARRKKMDWVGVFTVAFITAFGGGTLRDLLLDRRPLFWVEHQAYPVWIFLAVILLTPFWRYLRRWTSEKYIEYADALGLGLFSVSGTSLAMEMNMPAFISVMMGVITGIFGGVLRDMICNEIPMVFRRGQLYASCAFVGCWVYWLSVQIGVQPIYGLYSGILSCSLLRLAAMYWNWRLPG